MQKIKVPLIKQTKEACGPTALAMVLKYFDDKKPLQEIIKEVGGIKKFGVRTISLAKFSKKLGYKVHCYSYNVKLAKGQAKIVKPNKQLILKFLKKRLPVIIAVRTFLLNNTKYTRTGHFIVITKYQNGKFCFNDPHTAKERIINENDLMFAWYNNVMDSSAYMLVLGPKKR